jgi:tetratricopeptide (TPR) repeat protein
MALSDIYFFQGHDEKAEKAARKALDMATTRGQGTVSKAKLQLAEIQYFLGNWDEAENLVSQFLDVDNKRPIPQFDSPPDYPMSLMASICHSKGRLKEAGDWAAHTMKVIYVNGSTYPSGCAARCVEIMLKQWKLGESSAIITQNLAASLSEYGQENMHTECWLSHYGALSMLQGAWEEAESCLLASISTLKKITGPRSPRLRRSFRSLFYLYAEQLSWDQASAVLSEYRELVRSPRFSVMDAEVLDALGRHNEAWDALQGLEARFPLDATWNNSVMVKILRNLGRLEESQELGARTLTMAEGMFGDSHPQTIRCKDNLARTYMAGGDAVAAIQAMTECVQLFTTHEGVGPDHYLTRRSRDILTEWLVFADPASVSPFQVQDLGGGDVEMLY